MAILIWWCLNFALVSGVVLADRDLGWQHARLGELLWLLVGQVAVLLLALDGCRLVGAVRAVRRRAPLLRRRYAGRYVSAEVLAELAVDAPAGGEPDRRCRAPAGPDRGQPGVPGAVAGRLAMVGSSATVL